MITAINLQFEEQSSLFTLLVLLSLLTHVYEECTYQLALPWGTRHLISPELAGKNVLNLFFLLSSCFCGLTRAVATLRCVGAQMRHGAAARQ